MTAPLAPLSIPELGALIRDGRIGAMARLPWRDIAALPLAWSLLAGASLALRIAHFRRLAPLLGKPLGAVGCVPIVTERQAARARFVKRAIRRAALIMPLRRDCLPQTLAGAAMCRLLRVPATAHLGVRIDDPAALRAHAWLCSGAVPVTGGYAFDLYTPVSCFATRR